jgi:hypothetical protein
MRFLVSLTLAVAGAVIGVSLVTDEVPGELTFLAGVIVLAWLLVLTVRGGAGAGRFWSRVQVLWPLLLAAGVLLLAVGADGVEAVVQDDAAAPATWKNWLFLNVAPEPRAAVAAGVAVGVVGVAALVAVARWRWWKRRGPGLQFWPDEVVPTAILVAPLLVALETLWITGHLSVFVAVVTLLGGIVASTALLDWYVRGRTEGEQPAFPWWTVLATGVVTAGLVAVGVAWPEAVLLGQCEDADCGWAKEGLVDASTALHEVELIVLVVLVPLTLLVLGYLSDLTLGRFRRRWRDLEIDRIRRGSETGSAP